MSGWLRHCPLSILTNQSVAVLTKEEQVEYPFLKPDW